MLEKLKQLSEIYKIPEEEVKMRYNKLLRKIRKYSKIKEKDAEEMALILLGAYLSSESRRVEVFG